MVDRWHAVAKQVTVATTAAGAYRSLLDVSQASSGTKVLRCYRFWHFDSYGAQTGASGNIDTYVIARIEGGVCGGPSSMATLLPARRSSVIPESVSAGQRRYGGVAAPTNESILRRYARSADRFVEPLDVTINGWEMLISMALVLEVGYRDSTIEPIVVRANQAIHIRQDEAAADDCILDFEIEFTVGDS